MNFRISVAIATYNGEKFIEEQLQSILDQTVQVDEVIICDDRYYSFADDRVYVSKNLLDQK